MQNAVEMNAALQEGAGQEVVALATVIGDEDVPAGQEMPVVTQGAPEIKGDTAFLAGMAVKILKGTS